MSDYVPSETGARLAYVAGLIDYAEGNVDEQRKELRAEFDRFVANIKAEAWDEALGYALAGSGGKYSDNPHREQGESWVE